MVRKKSPIYFLIIACCILYNIGIVLIVTFTPEEYRYSINYIYFMLIGPLFLVIAPFLLIIFLLSRRSVNKNKVRPSTGVYTVPISKINTGVYTNSKLNTISDQKITSKFCSYCGERISSGDEFCPQCNTKIEK